MDVDGSRLIFVGGLHRSGTTPLGRALAAHPNVSGLADTGVKEDEGQHLQSVYPPARTFGGPGRFARKPAAHLTETSALVSPANAEELLTAWSAHWDMSRSFLLEKSPPNLIMGRYLQALFPGSSLVVVIRHPIIVSLSTMKWAPHTSLHRLVEHWFLAHRIFRADLSHLQRVSVVRYEDLVRDPVTTMAQIADLVGLGSVPPTDSIQGTRSSSYEQRWTELAGGTRRQRHARSKIEHDFADEAARYGYDIADPTQFAPLPSLSALTATDGRPAADGV